MPQSRASRRRRSSVARATIEFVEQRLLLATVPSGFTDTELTSALTSPTALDVAPDGRVFIAQQNGTIRVVKNDQLLATPFVDLSAQVDGTNERGMLGLTLDPNFSSNGYVYVYYTAKTPNTHNRIVRMTASGDVMHPNSLTAIVDFPDIGSAVWHMGGPIHFGPDGKLYVGVGDHQQSAQSQSLNSVYGKMLRLNPDGSIPTDNPFYTQTTGINRSIWARGLRNPFTFDFQPGTGMMYINDVGNTSFEEINQGIAGANYGWPSTEGDFTQSSFPNFTRPVYSYSHSVGWCIAGAAFYNPPVAKFPSQYVGKFFFFDFSFGWMKFIDPNTKAVTNFATGMSFPTDAEVADDGTIYFLQRGTSDETADANSGSLHKLDYPSGNVPPNIVQQPQNQQGAVGQQVTFSVSATGTPPMSYQWKRNGQNISGATASTYVRTIASNDNGAVFTVTITNPATSITSNGATINVLVGAPPNPSINTPTLGTPWSAGTTVSFSGSATDPEDITIGAAGFTWQVDYITGNVSRPLLLPTSGITSGSFVIPNESPYTGTQASFRIILTVRDSNGNFTTRTRDIFPNLSTASFATNVPGLSLNLDGASQVAPFSTPGVVGLLRRIEAPATQSVNGVQYQFSSWSDGGAIEHFIPWPATAQTYTANYVVAPVTYVSDLPYSQAPTNGWGPPERDRSNGESGASDGGPIRIGGVTYSKGFGVHASSDMRFNIAAGNFGNFLADIGMDDEVGNSGSVIFRVFLDNTQVFDSGVMTGSSATQSINIPIPSGTTTLRLVVTDGGTGGNTSDHASWGNARLTGTGTGTPPPPSLFAAPTFNLTGNEAHGVATGDLNFDGFLDLAVANAGANTVSVLLGTGTGTFGAATSYGVGSQPKSVTLGDLNGDNRLDMVTANQGTGNVSVLLNNGNGTFAAAIAYAGTSGAHEVALANVDTDNDLDIIEVGWGASLLRVLFNNGSGVFSGGTNYNIGAAPHSVVARDFNGDNRPDLAVANHDSNNVGVLINNGNGTFAAQVTYATGARPHSIRTGHLNGDAFLDLATANENSNNVSVLFGTGTGTFATAVNYATGLVPKGVAIGDVDNDGDQDLLTANTAGNYPSSNNPGGDQISVLRNNGSGIFGSATNYTTGRTPFSIALGDFDGDGDLDAATANWHTDDVGILKNSTAGAPPPSNPPANTPPVTIGDSASTPMNQAIVVNVLANDSDPGGSVNPITVVVTVPPLHGITSVNAVTGLVTYTPENNYSGPDSFQYTVKDNFGLTSAAALVSITVNPVVVVGATTYLSDLTPTFAQNGWGTYERDRSNGEMGATDGNTITLNGVTYAKGLGMHASGELRYNLVGGNYSEFRAFIGIDDEAGSNGNAQFLVYVDNVLRYTSPNMTGTSATQEVVVSVAGGSELRLVLAPGVGGNTWDHGDWADAKLLQSAGVTAPAAPTNLTANYVANQINLNWTDASNNEQGFRVERKTTINGNYGQIADLPAGSTSYADTNIVPGTTYYYHVYAYNAAGPSVASNEADATTSSGSTSVVYLSDLNPTLAQNGWGAYQRDGSNGETAANDGGQINLNGVSYDKGLGVHALSDLRYTLTGTGATEFRADIGVDDEVGNGGSVVFVVSVDNVIQFTSSMMTGSSATQSIVVPLAANAGTLRLVVTDGGNGNASDHADWADARLMTGTPVVPTAPSQPTGLNAVLNGSSVNLTWTDVATTETSYRVERKTGAVGAWALLTNLAAGATSHTDNGPLAAGTQYFYRVFAVNAVGDSTASNESNITVPAGSTTTYLSNINWTSATNGWGAVERDRSNGEMGATDGRTITLNGVTYAKGLGVHANSDITFNLAGQYQTFITDIGIDDESGSNGSVIFRIYLDGVLAFDSGMMTGTSATQTVNLALAGKNTLRLVVDAGGNGNAFDHADWAGARLLS